MINRIFEAKKLYENKEYDKALKVLDSLEELNLDVLNLYAEIFKSKKMLTLKKQNDKICSTMFKSVIKLM